LTAQYLPFYLEIKNIQSNTPAICATASNIQQRFPFVEMLSLFYHFNQLTVANFNNLFVSNQNFLYTDFSFQFADISQQQNKILGNLVLQKTQNKQQNPLRRTPKTEFIYNNHVMS
jgi:hypothetical protein